MKKVFLLLFLGLLLLWVTGIVLENFFNVDLDKYFNRSFPPTQAAVPAAAPAAESAPATDAPPSDWKTYHNDDFHFSITGPYEWKASDSSAPTTFKGIVAKGFSPDLKFVVQVMAHEMPSANIDLNKAADQQVKALQLMDKIMVNLQVTTSPVTVADTPGLLVQGTYQAMGKVDEEMKTFNIAKGTTLLAVMFQYQPNDENRATADKIVHSLSFSN